MAVGTINVSVRVHGCSSQSEITQHGDFWRIIALERPVVFQPRKAFERDTVTQNFAITASAFSISVGAVAAPIAAMQMGATIALLRIAQCQEDNSNNDKLEMGLHPLQFPLGEGAKAYTRGAVVGNIVIIPSIWAAIAGLIAPAIYAKWTKRSMSIGTDFFGWPGAALTPIAVLSEAIAMVSIDLITNAKESSVDAVIGAIGVLVLLLTAASWVRTLRLMYQVKNRDIVCVKQSHLGFLGLFQAGYEWQLLRNDNPECLDDDVLLRSVPSGCVDSKDASSMSPKEEAYLAQRMSLVGDSRWLWAAFVSYVLAVAVGLAEGISATGNEAACKGRWALAATAAVLQSLVALTNTVPIELWLLGLVGALSGGLVILVSLSTFGVIEHTDATFAAMNVLGTISSIVGIILMFVGAVAAGLESYLKNKRISLQSMLDDPTSTFFDFLGEWH